MEGSILIVWAYVVREAERTSRRSWIFRWALGSSCSSSEGGTGVGVGVGGGGGAALCTCMGVDDGAAVKLDWALNDPVDEAGCLNGRDLGAP